MRKSLEDISFMVVPDKTYPGIPAELKPYYVYLRDAGHCILCIPEKFRADAKDDPDMYECPVPVKYVLSHKYSMENGYIYIDVPYHDMFGISAEGYEEF
jgi:hypothetical protein